MLYDPRKSNFSKIERESGVKFEHLSAPQPADVAQASGVVAAETITQISDRYSWFLLMNSVLDCCGFQILIYFRCSVIPVFKSAAEDLLNTSGLSAVELLAKALAKAAVSLFDFFLPCSFELLPFAFRYNCILFD